MYLEHFGLHKKPFSTTPDPRFLYLSSKHREALAHLLFGTRTDSSFVLLTGEIGTGKTTLCRTLLEKPPADIHIALILNPLLTPYELLAAICDEFGIPYRPETKSTKVLVDRINVFLLDKYAKGHRCILIIDEAQNLGIETLEQIRLLTNLETGDHKLLKIMLIGQPELNQLLEQPALKQLNQRITARYHLLPLDEKETAAYIRHRMNKAGSKADIFTAGAAKKIFQLARGVPRVVNLIAERALLGAYAQNRRTIDKKLVTKAADEVLGKPARLQYSLAQKLTAASFVLGLLAITIGAWNLYLHKRQADPLVIQKPAETENKTDRKNEKSAAAPTQRSGSFGQVKATYTPPAPAKPEPPAADLNLLLTRQINHPTAIESLFVVWGIPPASLEGNTACEKAAGAGLGCIYDKGDFAELTSYNRPAVLELTDKSGNRHQILLTGLETRQAEIRIDNKKHHIEIDQLLRYWNGDYLVFWKQPPGGLQIIKPGDSGEAIVWLNNRLDSVLGNDTENPAPRYFGESLRQKLVEFQKMAGIMADGIAGPQTLVKLATLAGGEDIPTLNDTQQTEIQ